MELRRDALRAGLTLEQFWSYTPAELCEVLDAAAWRQEQALRRELTQAWTVAALSRMKRLPTLKRLLRPRRARRLSGAELEARRQEFAELSARMGGQRPAKGRAHGR